MNVSGKINHQHGKTQSLLRSVNKRAQNTLSTLTDFLLPPRCAHCNQLVKQQHSLCGECWNNMRFIEKPYCPVMGSPFSYDMGENVLSTQAIANPPPFQRLRSAVLYDETARSLVSRFKFSDRNDLAPFLASMMERAGSELLSDAQIILPLPLHRSRLRTRRFNQSAELARIIHTSANSRGMTKAIYQPAALVRVKNTRQQIGLSRNSRQQNVAGAFTVPQEFKPEIAGKRVLLIDDVYTSGASAISATKALKRGGAQFIDVLTFARVHSDII